MAFALKSAQTVSTAFAGRRVTKVIIVATTNRADGLQLLYAVTAGIGDCGLGSRQSIASAQLAQTQRVLPAAGRSQERFGTWLRRRQAPVVPRKPTTIIS